MHVSNLRYPKYAMIAAVSMLANVGFLAFIIFGSASHRSLSDAQQSHLALQCLNQIDQAFDSRAITQKIKLPYVNGSLSAGAVELGQGPLSSDDYLRIDYRCILVENGAKFGTLYEDSCLLHREHGLFRGICRLPADPMEKSYFYVPLVIDSSSDT